MRQADDHEMIFWSLLGLVTLVFASVFLSLMMDKRLSFSESRAEMERELSSGEAELAELRALHSAAEQQLRSASSGGHGSAESALDPIAQLDELRKQHRALLETRDSLHEAIHQVDKRFTDYQRSYREASRNAATGEKMPSLVTRSGREYQNVRINRVTPVGIEVTHADGIARIASHDLPEAFHDRFQWDEEERMAELLLEEQNRRRIAAPSGPPPTTPPPPVHGTPSQDPAALRARVMQWRGKVADLSAEYRTAQSMAVRGRNVSVPGSLETWDARLRRLDSDLRRARLELIAARADLSKVAPNDRLTLPGIDED